MLATAPMETTRIIGGDGNESGTISSFSGQTFVGGLFGGEGK